MLHHLHRYDFEWHDLTVARIAIVERGVIIDALPYNDRLERYDHVTLSLLDADPVSFNIVGQLTPKDLGDLAIKDFDIAESPSDRITATLGILCGHAGYWTIQVKDARWELVEHGAAEVQFPEYA